MGTFYKQINLPDGTILAVHFLTRNDLDQSHDFFQSLPEKDRLYLRRDVTKYTETQRRYDDVESGHGTVLIARQGERIVGDCYLYVPTVKWFRYLGETRIIVARDFQRRGLGRMLVNEMIAIAKKKGLKKLEATAMAVQEGAISMLENCGFAKEGVLERFAVDLRGQKQNLVYFGLDLDL